MARPAWENQNQNPVDIQDYVRIRDTNNKLLDELKRKREEHAALTTAEKQNIELARESHYKKVSADEARNKAARDEIAATKVQNDITRTELDGKSKELAVWQRKLELKELSLQDIETSLNNQSNEVHERIRKYRTEMEDKIIKLRGEWEKVRENLEKCELAVHLL